MSAEDDGDFIVTIADVRGINLCCSGARRWFELHNLDFKKFVNEGIKASEVMALNDDFARRVVSAARASKGKADGRRG